MHNYLRVDKDDFIEVEVPAGYPHGDAWGFIMKHPQSHDVERYLEALKKKQKEKKKK